MRNTIFVAFCAIAFLFARSRNSLQPGGFAGAQYETIATVPSSWWVHVSLPGTGNLIPLPILLQTYDAVDNTPDSMWLDDLQNLALAYTVGFHRVGVDNAAIDYVTLSFSVANVVNHYGDTASTFVTVLGGKILPMAGHSLSGDAVDSIFMRAVISNAPDPADTFTIAGVARN